MRAEWVLKMKLSSRLWVCGLLMAALVFGTGGCTVANMAVSPFNKITLVGADDLNPDINGRPSPVQVKVLHLSARTTFDNLSFDELFFNAKTLLSDELLLEQNYTLQPKEKIKEKHPVDKGTRFVAVLAAYRDIDRARWRHITRVSDKHYYSHRFEIGSLAIVPSKTIHRKLANKELFDNTVETAEKAETAAESVESIKSASKAAKLP